jgi:hypothetical protein
MRYFFHYHDDHRHFTDDEGTELADLDGAIAEGRSSARELLGTERAESDPTYIDGKFEITDQEGLLLATVLFREQLLTARAR